MAWVAQGKICGKGALEVLVAWTWILETWGLMGLAVVEAWAGEAMAMTWRGWRTWGVVASWGVEEWVWTVVGLGGSEAVAWVQMDSEAVVGLHSGVEEALRAMEALAGILGKITMKT